MKSVLYLGAFLTEKSKMKLLSLSSVRHQRVYADHLTLVFKPSDDAVKDFERVKGKTVQIRVVGYTSDEKGEAVLVERDDVPFPIGNLNPHITITCAEGVAPVYSNEMLEKLGKAGMKVVAGPNKSSAQMFETFTVDAVLDTYPRSTT